jgi:UDPglucose 6-dehydrogenase
MKIALIGSGYVGLVAAACLCELGHEVTYVDNDPEKLRLLVHGGVPIHEEFLPELIAHHRGKQLHFSGDFGRCGQGQCCRVHRGWHSQQGKR